MEDLSLTLEEINNFVKWVEATEADTIEFFLDEHNMPSASFDGFNITYDEWNSIDSNPPTLH